MSNFKAQLESNSRYQGSSDSTWFFNDNQGLVDMIYTSEAYDDGNSSLSSGEADRAGESIAECEREWFIFSHYDTNCLQSVAARQFHPINPLSGFLNKLNRALVEKQAEAEGVIVEKNAPEVADPATIQLMAQIDDPLLAGYLASRVRDNDSLHTILFDLGLSGYVGGLFGSLSKLSMKMQPEDFVGLFKEWAFDFPRSLNTFNVLKQTNDEKMLLQGVIIDPMRVKFVETLYQKAFELDYRDVLESQEGTPQMFREMLAHPDTKQSIALTNKTLEIWAQKGFSPELLMTTALEETRSEVVVEAFRLLATYSDKRAVDFFIQRVEKGPYRLAVLVKKALYCTPQREYAIKCLKELTSQANPYVRRSGEIFLAEIKAENGDPSSASLWKDLVTDPFMPERYTTAFFRHQQQLGWITSEAQRLLRERPNEELSILSVGGSFGPEAYSVLMTLDMDYERNPAAWNNRHPFESITMHSTDIDELAVLYAARGHFRTHPCDIISDTFGLFDIEGENDDVVEMRGSLRERLKTSTLDILNREDVTRLVGANGRPQIVLYNYVDTWLGGDEGSMRGAAHIGFFDADVVMATALYPKSTYGTLERTMDVMQLGATSVLFHARPTMKKTP
jgi:CheR methyltransferase-like protein